MSVYIQRLFCCNRATASVANAKPKNKTAGLAARAFDMTKKCLTAALPISFAAALVSRSPFTYSLAGINVAAFCTLHLLEKFGDVAILRLPQPLGLMIACKLGRSDLIQQMIENGADANARIFRDGSTLLHYAIRHREAELAQVLITHRANVNAADHRGLTPLHETVLNNLPLMATLLLRNGANVNAATKDGMTPIFVASLLGNKTFLELLLPFNPSLLGLGNRSILGNRNVSPAMIQILLGLQGCSEFNSCKSIHDFCDLLFPPSRDKLPSNWKEIIKMVPECPHFIELEKELPSLRSRIQNFDALGAMLAVIYRQSEKAKGRTHSAEGFMRYLTAPPANDLVAALEKTNPLFSRMYALAGRPKVVITQNVNIDANYHPETNTISVQPQESIEELVFLLIFETVNALQRDATNQLFQSRKSQKIQRESCAIAGEWIETRTAYWHKKALDPMIQGRFDFLPDRYSQLTDNLEKNFEIAWKDVNKRSQNWYNGAYSHTDAFRRDWDLDAAPEVIMEAARAYKQKKADVDTIDPPPAAYSPSPHNIEMNFEFFWKNEVYTHTETEKWDVYADS